MAQLKDLLVTGDSRFVGNMYHNQPKIAYGTCATAAATAVKVVEINDPTWNLQIGDIIGVKFTNTNSASSCTLDVNSTGAKSLWYNNAAYTGSSNMICGYANRYIFYMYDGTYWVWLTYGNENSGSDTYPSAYCSTGAGTAAKAATCTNYQLLANSYLHIVITNANTSATALTLNVNGKGAKPIYINGTASSTTNYTLPAGSYIIYYNGTNYYFRTDGKLTASITGDAATVGGKTVATNVPSGAVFTDTKNTAGSTDSSSKLFLVGATSQAANPQTYSQDTAYVGTDGHLYSDSKQVVNLSGTQALTNKTYNGYVLADGCSKGVDTTISAGSTSGNVPTAGAVASFVEGKGYVTTDTNTTYTFAGGTNKFTVTPSGGTAQTVTITPSITNNVTGSGTSGYLTKFNGANSITNGPQLGSSTTTYLRNNGTWGDPKNVYVGTSAPSGSNYEVWVDPTATLDKTTFINMIYPVGSIYISTSSTNPGTTFGVGTWVAYGQGRVLIGAGTGTDSRSEQKSFTGGGTGGEYNHLLAIAEIPAHNHNSRSLTGSATNVMWDDGRDGGIAASGIVSVGGWTRNRSWNGTNGDASRALNINATHTHDTQGGSGVHNNIQPYIVVYMWRRTA